MSSNVKHRANILQVKLLKPLIDSLISEKRMQYRHSNIQIEVNSTEAYSLFVKINVTEFKRNNSIEATENEEKVELNISEFDSNTIAVKSVLDEGTIINIFYPKLSHHFSL